MSSTSSSSSSSASRVTGMVSGFDTTSIVESLMTIEKKPYTKLEVKKQTEELKLQAYQAVNTYLLKFRTSMSSLASSKLWNAKSAVSSNEKSLTATASQYAVKGSYSFKTAQLATAAQYTSKGFASKTAALADIKNSDGETVSEKIGSISLNSSKTRVDNSAKLEQLNGGKGAYRGSVRVTDANNNSSIIDLSSCDTMDDVVNTLNNSDKAQITASIKDGALHIEDNSRGTGSLRIQNVGTGTTATDLGIAGTAAYDSSLGKAVLQGRNVYTMGNDTALSALNDGLGVEEGKFNLRISDAGNYVNLTIDTTDCKTVGDLTKKVNSLIEEKRKSGKTDAGGGDYATFLDGLSFGMSEDKLSFGLTGVKHGLSYEFTDPASHTMGKATPAEQLGLTNGTHIITAPDQTSISFNRVMGDVNSPMLKTLGGVDSSSKMGEPKREEVSFNADTKVSSMCDGKGLNYSRPLQIRLTEGGSSNVNSAANSVTFSEILDMDYLSANFINNKDATIGDLVDYMNSAMAKFAADPANNAAGLNGMRFKAEEGAVTLEGAQAGYKVEILGNLAADLGLTRVDATVDGIEVMKTARDGYTDQGGKFAADIDSFYGISGHQSLLSHGTVDMNPATATLQDLTGFHGLKRADFATDEDYTAAVGTKLQELFAKEDGISIKTNQNLILSDGSAMSVPVEFKMKLADVAVLDADGNVVPGATLDENTDVDTFMRSVNAAIQTGMTDAARAGVGQFATELQGGLWNTEIPDAGKRAELLTLANDFAANGTMSAPQMRLHTYADSLQWSNMDFSRGWEMGGDVLAGLHLDKTIDLSEGQEANAMLLPDASTPTEAGYYSMKTVTGDTTLAELNLGVGITLAGDETNTIDFTFGKDADGNDVSISFNMKELQDRVQAKGEYACKLSDYADILNTLAHEKIDAYNLANGTNYGMDIGLNIDANGTPKLQISNIKGITEQEGVEESTLFTIGGSGATMIRTGLSAGAIDNPDASAKYTISDAKSMMSAEFMAAPESDTTTLGTIEFTLGNSDKRYSLNTDGLTEYNSLNDLLNHMNDQLAAMAKDASLTETERTAFRNMSFRVNDAGTGIALDNNSSQRVTFKDTVDGNGNSDANRLGQTLGLIGADNADVKVESYTRYNGASLGRNYISRATSLDDFLGKDAVKGTIVLTNAAGTTKNLDLRDCKSVGDVLDYINHFAKTENFGVMARINEAGNGIDIYEDYFSEVDPKEYSGNISIKDLDTGNTAKKLGIAGTGTRATGDTKSPSVFEGSLGQKIDVMSTDSLESIMYRLAASGDYKCAIVNDGSANSPYRLTITSAATGEASDFVIDSNMAELFGFNQSTRGKDAKVLYGDPNSSASPIMLSSSTNTNSTAVLGLTLDMKSASSEWTTITVDEDKDAIKEEIKNMVQSYNDLAGIVSYLDAYDEETGEPGILFGDNSVRGLMDSINESFYQIFNPNNVKLGTLDSEGKQQTWTWMDLGVSLTAKNTNTDGSGSWYTTMELDLDKLDEMFASKWDVVSQMLSNTRNASNINATENNKPVATFNGKLAKDFSANGAINGDATKGGWGAANGVMAGETIAKGANEYTVFFQQPTTMSKLSIYHYSADTALKDFTIEYLDDKGDWQTFREVTGNKSDANHMGTSLPITMSALRITANSTNAKDDTFRLLDVQVYEEIGLAGSLNQITQKLGDTQLGFLAERTESVNNSISDLDSQMTRLQTKLDAKEEALWRKFTAMETALGKLQNQGTYFSNMMSGMKSS